MTATLFSPIRIGELDFANRIAVAPMCQYSADDGSASDWHLQHWMMLAMTGAGMVTVEMTDVERRGRITHGCLGLYSDHNEAAAQRALDCGAGGGGAWNPVRGAARPCRAQGLVPAAVGGRQAAHRGRGCLGDRVGFGGALRRRAGTRRARWRRRRSRRWWRGSSRRRSGRGGWGSTSSSCTARTDTC